MFTFFAKYSWSVVTWTHGFRTRGIRAMAKESGPSYSLSEELAMKCSLYTLAFKAIGHQGTSLLFQVTLFLYPAQTSASYQFWLLTLHLHQGSSFDVRCILSPFSYSSSTAVHAWSPSNPSYQKSSWLNFKVLSQYASLNIWAPLASYGFVCTLCWLDCKQSEGGIPLCHFYTVTMATLGWLKLCVP